MINNNIKDFEWLTGQWECLQGTGIYHEEWETLLEEGKLTGKAYLIMKGEIKNVEKLSIHSDESGTYYTADVSHNPKPVSFKLTSQIENTFIFENPEHDFPQKITYKKLEGNSLLAVVEASKNGKVRKIEYNLKKLS